MKRIFLVEDDPDILEIMQTVLNENGFLTILPSERDIYFSILSAKPDLVIMDLFMPSIDGAELTKILKSRPKTRKIPVILVSANNHLDRISKESGADGYLPKPFGIKDLVSTVEKFIKSR